MKRFWKQAATTPVTGGFGITLDGKPMRTPAKRPLVVPSLALAEAVAAEWNEQPADFNPETMALTRFANTAVDRVADLRAEVVAELANWAGTDLVSYRATEPPELIERQRAAWDPVVEWLRRRYDISLAVTHGLMPVAQAEDTVPRLAAVLDAHGDGELAALHTLVGMLGSLALALAVAEGEIELETAWIASRIDEQHQIDAWGEDAEAAERARRMRADLGHAHRFLTLLRS